MGARPVVRFWRSLLERWILLPLLGMLGQLAADTADRLGGWLGVIAFYVGVRRQPSAALMQRTLGLRGPARARALRQAYASTGANFLNVWAIGGVDGPERHLSQLAPRWTARLLARHPGAVALTLHLGSWDAGALAVQALGRPVVAYAKELQPPAVDAAINACRQATGVTIHHARRGDRTEAVRILRALRGAAWLGLLADQRPARDEGEAAWLLGQMAWCHPGAAFFANKANVPLIPMCCVRIAAGRYALFTGRPLAQRTTQAAMDAVSALIAAAPGQYFWMHYRFKQQPTGLVQRPVEPWREPGLLRSGA